MKTLVATAIAVAVSTAASDWAGPAAADEPFELNRIQLDRVAAGKGRAGDDRLLETTSLNFALPTRDGDTLEFSLRVDSPGTEFEHSLVRTFSLPRTFLKR